MKTTQHTPGKWTYEVWHYDTRGDRLVVQIGKDAIAELIPLYRPTIEQSKAETEANARFIVTACNAYGSMLAACKEIIQDYQDLGHVTPDAIANLQGVLKNLDSKE